MYFKLGLMRCRGGGSGSGFGMVSGWTGLENCIEFGMVTGWTGEENCGEPITTFLMAGDSQLITDDGSYLIGDLI